MWKVGCKLSLPPSQTKRRRGKEYAKYAVSQVWRLLKLNLIFTSFSRAGKQKFLLEERQTLEFASAWRFIVVVNGAGAGTDGNERTWRLRKMCIQRGYKLVWFTLLWLWAKLCFSQYLLPDTIWLQTEAGRCMSYEANSTSFCVDIYQTQWQGRGGAQSNGTHISQGGRRGSTGTPISGWVSGKLFGLCGAFIVHLFASQYASSPFAVGDKRAAMGKRQPATVNWKEPTAVLLNSYKGFAFASSKQAKRKKAIKII